MVEQFRKVHANGRAAKRAVNINLKPNALTEAKRGTMSKKRNIPLPLTAFTPTLDLIKCDWLALVEAWFVPPMRNK